MNTCSLQFVRSIVQFALFFAFLSKADTANKVSWFRKFLDAYAQAHDAHFQHTSREIWSFKNEKFWPTEGPESQK